MTPTDIAKYIDHTLLKPEATEKQIYQLCQEAREYKFASVCINPMWVAMCANLLSDTEVKICTVVGFPLGANMPEIKAEEALAACRSGANEIDMVINIGTLKMGHTNYALNDIINVRRKVHWVTLKVIIEACLLAPKEKIIACQIAKEAGADFVKTSTGFSTGGATIDDVKLMRQVVRDQIGVKASGGIRDFATAKAMLGAGANRLGCSNSVAIVSHI